MTRREDVDHGATLVEYALVVALVVVVLIGVMSAVEDNSKDKLEAQDERIGLVEDNAAYQPPLGGGGPTPTLPPPSGGGTMASPALTATQGATNLEPGNKWVVYVTVLVTDTASSPVSGVTVSFRWNSSGPTTTCTTNGMGQCLLSETVNDNTTTASIEITAMEKTNWTAPTLPVSGAFTCAPLDASCD